MPKIDLISIPGKHQGVRIEDCISFIFLFYLFFSNKLTFSNTFISNFQYKNYYYFFIYLFFSNIVGILSNIDMQLIMIIRLIEYIIFLFFIDRLNISKKIFLKLLKYFLLVNLIIAILQINELVGSFSSLGYQPTEAEINQRALGLLGGSWELSITSSLAYLFIYENDKNKLIKLIYFFITFFLVIVSESKTQTLAFFLLNFLLLIKNKNFLLLSFLSIAVIASIIFVDINIFNKIKSINFSYLFDLTYQTFVRDNLPSKEDVENPYVHLSYWYRLNFWRVLFDEYISNFATVMFGTGFSRIYTESIYIRVIFSSGIFGSLYLLYLLRNTKLIYLFYFSFAGLTIDLFISLKIFLITLLIVKNNFNEKNNIGN